jgi:hypothetical protein
MQSVAQNISLIYATLCIKQSKMRSLLFSLAEVHLQGSCCFGKQLRKSPAEQTRGAASSKVRKSIRK